MVRTPLKLIVFFLLSMSPAAAESTVIVTREFELSCKAPVYFTAGSVDPIKSHWLAGAARRWMDSYCRLDLVEPCGGEERQLTFVVRRGQTLSFAEGYGFESFGPFRKFVGELGGKDAAWVYRDSLGSETVKVLPPKIKMECHEGLGATSSRAYGVQQIEAEVSGYLQPKFSVERLPNRTLGSEVKPEAEPGEANLED